MPASPPLASNLLDSSTHVWIVIECAVGSEKFIGSFANVGNGTYRVAGSKKPGLGEAFLLDMSAECMKFKQLAPLSKINFAIVTTALEFAIVLYGALFVYTPRFNGCLENCGK